MYSARGQQMYEYLSWYYRNSRVMQTVLDSQGVEIDAARNTLEESLKQFYAELVGDWGIEYWEKELAITPPANASLELRRALVKAKLLATEIMTPKRIEAICNCFVPTQAAQVVEVPQTYTFKVQTPFDDFVWIDEMRAALNSAKPAHMAAIVEYCAQFLDKFPELQTEYFLRCLLPSLVDEITWRGRQFDGGWHYTAPVTYDGAWLATGLIRFDGAVSGAEDPIIKAARFDSMWQWDGTKNFALSLPTTLVRLNSEEPDVLDIAAMIGQSDAHSVTLQFDGARRSLDGYYLFGPAAGAQDANDAVVAAALRQSDELAATEIAALQTDIPLRENYPLPRLQYFGGAWAFGQGFPLDGRWRFGTGEKFDGLSRLPDPTAFPRLLDGNDCFDGFPLSAPAPVVVFGADADAADAVSLGARLTATETIAAEETETFSTSCKSVDFAYADIRFDGSISFKTVSYFDGFWLMKGDHMHDAAIASRAATLREPEPLSGMFDGRILFNAGARSSYDGGTVFDTYAVADPASRFIGCRLQDSEDIGLAVAIQDAMLQASQMDGSLVFDGDWDLSPRPGFGEAGETEIIMGRYFGGGWSFNAGNTSFFEGTWNLDGSYMHTLLGACKNHYDGSLAMNGEAVFWKGGETFEHYRYAAN